MANITKAQLVQENEELRAQLQASHGEAEELRRKLAEADARIAKGAEIVRSLKAEYRVMQGQVAAKPRVVVRKAGAHNQDRPVVTRFWRGGQLWEKTRVGNQATERLVTAESGSPKLSNQEQ